MISESSIRPILCEDMGCKRENTYSVLQLKTQLGWQPKNVASNVPLRSITVFSKLGSPRNMMVAVANA